MLVDWKIVDGDLAAEDADAVLVTGPDAIYQEIIHVLETQATEWRFDTSLGLDFFDLMASDETDMVTIRAGLIAQIVPIEGVVRVVFADVRINGVSLVMQFGVLVEAEDSSTELLTFAAQAQYDALGEMMMLVTPSAGIAP